MSLVPRLPYLRLHGQPNTVPMPAELRPAPERQLPTRWRQPHRNACATWLLGILAPSAIFFTIVAPALPAAVTIAACIFLASSTLLLLLTACTDPGTLPRAEHGSKSTPSSPSEVVVNGFTLTIQTCSVCGIRRPPRASHCRVSDRCIERWDHYCHWVGTAIGRRNYHWFVCLIFCAAASALLVGGGSWMRLQLLAWQPGQPVIGPIRRFGHVPTFPSDSPPSGLSRALHVIAASPLGVLLLSYTVVVGLLLTLLTCYHAYLLSINQTTYENVRGKYRVPGTNPFDGGVIANCAEGICGWAAASPATDDGDDGDGAGDAHESQRSRLRALTSIGEAATAARDDGESLEAGHGLPGRIS